MIVGMASQMGCSKPQSFDGVTVPPDAQPSGEAFKAGRSILEESQKAYRSVESYHGTINVTGTTGYESGARPVTPRFFEVEFRSPDFLHLKGADSNGGSFAILIDGRKTEVLHIGDTKSFGSAEEALDVYGGVTLGGSVYLPGFLLDISWKNEQPALPRDQSLLTAWATKAELIGSAQVEDEDCHRIACERDTASWTIYVSKESKLVRRVDESVSELQMSRLRKRGWGGGASGQVISASWSYVFRINKVAWSPELQDANGTE
jgi:hypothetical protein